MRRLVLLTLSLLLVFFSGIVLSQDGDAEVAGTGTITPTPQIAFSIEGEIGRALPQKIVYDPQKERMAVVDAYNRLLLVNALDYSTLAVLHERGQYGDIAFSHDGRWLAVAYGITMELWDTDTQTLVGNLPDLGNARRLLGPMAFSSNDEILIFYGVYPAPRELRVTETDSITYPWVWHLPAARGEAESTLPNGLEAIQMVDYPNGFVLSPDDKIVAALPARLRVMDAFTLEPEYEIPTNRYEQDPLTVWFSLRDNSVYVRPVSSNTLLQVDTQRGVLVEIPLNLSLTQNDLDLIGGLEVGSLAQVIGGASSTVSIPLLEVLLGNYRHPDAYGARPLTITLVDLVLPPAAAQDNVLALLFVYDENADTGQFLFSRSGSVQQMTLSPDGSTLLVRRTEDDEYVITYDFASGRETSRFIPAQRGIGGYNRTAKNRVLAYDLSGAVVISDFQRLDAATNSILAEDLRYSRSFDRFFFSQDSRRVITLAGTEWREWDVETGAVLRREVVNLNGAIIATSADGYRYLTIYNDGNSAGAQVVDMNTNESYSVDFNRLPGSTVFDIYPNSSWTRFLVIYSENSYGPYYPGNQVAMYDYRNGLKWLIAGDDLPPIGQRLYGWVDEDTAFVYGQGRMSEVPGRVYGVDYALDGLPRCIVDAFPERAAVFSQLWERLVYYLRADELDGVTERLCGDVPDTAEEVEAMLVLTSTPERIVVTGAPTGPVPQCLLDRYPGEIEAYTDLWLSLTQDLSAEEAQEIAVMLCEGIGLIGEGGEFDPSQGITMFLDAETGERSSGDYQAPMVEERPLEPIYKLFEETEKRPLGTAILSPDNELVAASSMPGELVIYKLIVTYDSMMAQLTATAVIQLQEANLIKAQPSPSPTYNVIGTPRPTLTPTPEQTLYPRPGQSAFPNGSESTQICPAETLFSIDNPPMSYNASGRLHTEIQGDYLWSVDLQTGVRTEDPELLQCGRGIYCQFSPDHSWILAESYDSIFITRPDNSDPRTLWNLLTPNPPTPPPNEIYWSGNRTVEWFDSIPVTVPAPTPYTVYEQGYLRDVMNVFPDPNPWIPRITINELPAEYVSRQPGGPWAVAYTIYNTGVGPGFKYYLYHTETHIYQLFAQYNHENISVYWHPTGDRLFYSFLVQSGRPPIYQVAFPDVANQLVGFAPLGEWSNDGRYVAYRSESRAYPIGIWDSQTGDTRTYCLPETGARLYDGQFTWSPDNVYIALSAPLPKDESQEGVGQHTMILNVETGEVVDLTTGIVQILLWSQTPGTYGDGRIVSPTPTVTFTPSPTATP
jgi:WD40 repeat protein